MNGLPFPSHIEYLVAACIGMYGMLLVYEYLLERRLARRNSDRAASDRSEPKP